MTGSNYLWGKKTFGGEKTTETSWRMFVSFTQGLSGNDLNFLCIFPYGKF